VTADEVRERHRLIAARVAKRRLEAAVELRAARTRCVRQACAHEIPSVLARATASVLEPAWSLRRIALTW
jgi:hypothetical protein